MIYLDKDSRVPLYMQVYTQTKQEILTGILREGEILAGSRRMAATLHISRNTVDTAYCQLSDEGYVTAEHGIGYRVQKLPCLPALPEKEESGSTYPPAEEKYDTAGILYDLTNSSHTSDLFPRNMWRKYTLECLSRLDRESKLSIRLDRQGELYLRQNLRLYLERIRGVRCSENQIIITCGIQQSLDFLCKMLRQERTVILMEEPGYNKAAAVFYNNNLTVETVSVDENGIAVSRLPDRQDISAVYCTPSHQFPTGTILPVGRRYELLTWARMHHAFIIEDDFDSEQRYYAKPIPSLQSIDEDDSVIYLGTFSKALSPSLRMGYMILPRQLTERWLSLFQNYNSTVPLLNQYVIGRLIETGDYDRHVRRLNTIFRKRLERFTAEFSGMSSIVRITGNGTGQYFLLEFSGNVCQDILIQKALLQGVRVYPTMQFWQDKADCPPNTLFLGFSKIQLEDIHDCVQRLKTAWSAIL
jgi:GntR family transcriptional regulator / MocR family aminotransferase